MTMMYSYTSASPKYSQLFRLLVSFSLSVPLIHTSERHGDFSARYRSTRSRGFFFARWECDSHSVFRTCAFGAFRIAGSM